MSEEQPSVRALLNPVVLLALIVVVSTIAMIGAAVLGIDKGVLSNMSKSEFARGLITYLFAVVTIGTAVVLVLSALLGTEGEIHERRFQRGKEILALLLGVFGTIVGFYFGSAVSPKAETMALQLSTPDVDPRVAEAGSRVTVRAVASGGALPYRFGVGFGDDTVDVKEPVGESGWIVKEMPVRQFRPQETQVIRVIVQDASGQRVERIAPYTVGPPK
jgi:hypothetical protein